MLKSDEKKIIKNNYLALLLIQGANFILPLITLPYLVRTLGLEKYGLVMIAQSIALFLTIIVDFGFNISATRVVARLKNDKEKLSQFYFNVVFIKIVLILFTFLILLGMTTFIDRFNAEASVYLFSFGLVVGNAIFPTWFFQGIEKMRMISFINISAKLIFTISIFFIILSPNDYEYVPILNGVSFMLTGIIGFLFSLRYVNFVFPKSLELKDIVKSSFSLFVSNFAVSLYSSSNTLILGLFAGDSIAGAYASMEKLVLATKSLYIPLYQSIFPKLSTKPLQSVYNFTNKIKIPILISGLLITSIIIIGSKFILTLIYNDPIITSYNAIFQILGLIAVFSALNMLYVSLFFPAIKAYKVRMKILVASGIFHLGLILILVQFYGIYGAAISAAITELLILFLGYYFFKRTAR
jgi:PST family polysaccharide transporter